MSVKIQLEKNGEVIDASTGFSWATLFLGFWVPAFRKNSKGFGLFFLFFIVKVIIFYMLYKQNSKIEESLLLYGAFEVSYSMITPTLLAAAIYPLEVWIACFYNNYYTNNFSFSSSVLSKIPSSKSTIAEHKITSIYSLGYWLVNFPCLMPSFSISTINGTNAFIDEVSIV